MFIEENTKILSSVDVSIDFTWPSAAFDTIDHTILLRRLDGWFGATDKAFD